MNFTFRTVLFFFLERHFPSIFLFLFFSSCLCDTMWPFVVLGVCVCAGQIISLSTLARNPHKEPNGETFRETGSGRGKEGPRED